MIDIYTDGSANNTYAVCGYMAYTNHVLTEQKTKRLANVSANLAEMLAILMAMTDYPSQALRIYTDSEYVVKTISGEYKPKKYVDLWKTTKQLIQESGTQVTHVRAHNKNDRNNQIDKLVRTTLRKGNDN